MTATMEPTAPARTNGHAGLQPAKRTVIGAGIDQGSSDQKSPDQAQPVRAHSGLSHILRVIAGPLAVVVGSPVALSSQSLFHWAASPTGLNLAPWWAVAVFLALDGGALVSIAMTFFAALRNESAGAAHLMVWVLAAGSAFANHRYATEIHSTDAAWFLPSMSALAVVMVELVQRSVRRYARVESGVTDVPIPRYRALRWLFAPAETFAAVRIAVLDGITDHRNAVDLARSRRDKKREQRRIILDQSPAKPQVKRGGFSNKADLVRQTLVELNTTDANAVIQHLTEKGVRVHKSYVSRIIRQQPATEVEAPNLT